MKKAVMPIPYEQFHSLDYKVMGIAFAIHRELGRFWDEKIYQKELAYRCQAAGMEVSTEFSIEIVYKDFRKIYYIDLMIDNVIYELKTAKRLTSEHEKQTINYLLLTGLQHAKLINFQPSSVQYRFVSTNLTPEIRRNFHTIENNWLELDKSSSWLKTTFMDILNDWGCYLEVTLYQNALIHLLGGMDNVLQSIDVRTASHFIGHQKVPLLSPYIAFFITSLTKNHLNYERHLENLLKFTSLKAIHWINMNHSTIMFKTILESSKKQTMLLLKDETALQKS